MFTTSDKRHYFAESPGHKYPSLMFYLLRLVISIQTSCFTYSEGSYLCRPHVLLISIGHIYQDLMFYLLRRVISIQALYFLRMIMSIQTSCFTFSDWSYLSKPHVLLSPIGDFYPSLMFYLLGLGMCIHAS